MSDAVTEAMQQAADKLPECYTIRIDIEKNSGTVEWMDKNGDTHLIEGEGFISDDIAEALEKCIAHDAVMP